MLKNKNKTQAQSHRGLPRSDPRRHGGRWDKDCGIDPVGGRRAGKGGGAQLAGPGGAVLVDGKCRGGGAGCAADRCVPRGGDREEGPPEQRSRTPPLQNLRQRRTGIPSPYSASAELEAILSVPDAKTSSGTFLR